MMNKEFLEQHYKGLGYKYLGWLNTNVSAQEAYGKSENKQWHELEHCICLVALHDLKAYMFVDSGD